MSDSIFNDNLIGTLEQSLKQTRHAQTRLQARLREVESEGNRLRQEIDALENSAQKTTEAIHSILASMGPNQGSPDLRDLRIEDYTPNMRHDDQQQQGGRDNDAGSGSNMPPQNYQKNDYYNDSIAFIHNNPRNSNRSVPQVGQNIEPISQRFADRTITQACTLLLRESGKPLHVNELYNFLVAGGFEFTGKNPTISIAVSLNRNRRFRKVAPGTFDLVMRDASQAAS